VGEVVAEDYTRGAAFKRRGIDFCCGGGRTVQEACERAGVRYEDLAEDLARPVAPGGEPWADPRQWDLDLLLDHIQKAHHRYVRRNLPVLVQFTDKVARVHGGGSPELVEVARLVSRLDEALGAHLEDEERVAFPAVLRLLDAARSPDRDIEDLAGVFEGLRDEHEEAGEILGELRRLTGGFDAPDHACATYRASFALLAEFEEDLHRHVHLENNVLFPRAQALAARVATGSPSGAGA
jgi:regulator of cell morphogenesis and NO signaling